MKYTILLSITDGYLFASETLLLSLGHLLLPMWGVALDSECARPAIQFLAIRLAISCNPLIPEVKFMSLILL